MPAPPSSATTANGTHKSQVLRAIPVVVDRGAQSRKGANIQQRRRRASRGLCGEVELSARTRGRQQVGNGRGQHEPSESVRNHFGERAFLNGYIWCAIDFWGGVVCCWCCCRKDQVWFSSQAQSRTNGVAVSQAISRTEKVRRMNGTLPVCISKVISLAPQLSISALQPSASRRLLAWLTWVQLAESGRCNWVFTVGEQPLTRKQSLFFFLVFLDFEMGQPRKRKKKKTRERKDLGEFGSIALLHRPAAKLGVESPPRQISGG